MLVSYNDLFQKKDNLVSHLNEIDQWIEDTLTSDKTLTELESELTKQEEKLEENNDKAKVLIDKINTLDSMRNNLPRTEFRQRRSADDGYDDIDESDVAYSDKNLLDSIKETIENFEEDTESIDSQVKAMKFNDNFNSELEQIRNEINELKMTIAGTRDIANKINVAVNFSDTTFIHLRPSVSLKPALVTTGSFYIQTRAQFGPIVYIHNASDPVQYISVHLQNGKPFFQYRLSEKSFTSVTTNVPINDGLWHKVQIERVGRKATITVDDDQTASKTSVDDSVVFNIDSNGAKFILGQYPLTSILPVELETISTYADYFRGAIDDVKLNDVAYGLWSYEAAQNLKGEPKRPASMTDDINEQDAGNAIHFSKRSFMCLEKGIVWFLGRPLAIRIQFKTHSPDGLLWSWWDQEASDKPYLAIYLESGYVNVAFGKTYGEQFKLFKSIQDRSDDKLNDNKPHTLFVTLRVKRNRGDSYENNYILEIKASETLSNDIAKPIKSLTTGLDSFRSIKGGQQCLGGIPEYKRDGFFKTGEFTSFVGCMSNVHLPNSLKSLNLQNTLSSNKEHINVKRGCSKEDQCGFMSSNLPVFMRFNVLNKYDINHESVGLSFVTANPNGMLFYRKTSRGELASHGVVLQLQAGLLTLTIFEEDSSPVVVRSAKMFSDNKLHNIYLTKQYNNLIIKLDNEVVIKTNIESDFDNSAQRVTTNDLYISGLPRSEIIPNAIEIKNFEGCITQVIYNDVDLKFNEANLRSETGITFSECYKTPRKSSGVLMPDFKKSVKKITVLYSSKGSFKDFKGPQESKCLLSKNFDSSHARPVGIRFGLNKHSRLEVHDSFPIKISTVIDLKIRTLHPDGLIFYASDDSFGDFLAIWMQEGYINYAFDLGTGIMHIKSNKKYGDGRFHTISASRDMQSGKSLNNRI